MIPDHEQRTTALNTSRSYIVQAPAGSGKTGLLVQRYLALLAEVPKYPEQILAITFSRKAAAEMRERIIAALESDTSPEKDYEKTTWELAQRVLARDKKEQWQLLQNPGRLRIQTIDAFCAYLTKRLPLLSELGVSQKITETPEQLYETAALELLKTIDEKTAWQASLITLLTHLDNNAARFITLIKGMLERREQWLPYILASRNDKGLRTQLEKNLSDLINDQLQSLHAHIPSELFNTLIRLTQKASENVENDSIIKHCAELSKIPEPNAEQLKYWQAIATLLVTQNGTWRKSLSTAVGFPSPSSAPDGHTKQEWKVLKQDMLDVLTELKNIPELEEKWANVIHLPESYYSEKQWQILNALFTLLPLAVAQLHVLFKENQTTDYTEVALKALLALGNAENPTDLSLRLDYELHHILVDEFQDTSSLQWQLLERLTSGWQNNDSRTLFLVGDPMQSIYRFRKAEVSLFLKAQEQGLEQIKLTPLQLSTNFRSQAPIIEWVNHTFMQLMPKQANMSSGAIPYHPSIAMTDSLDNSKVIEYPLAEELADETKAIVELIKQEQSSNPNNTIGILVQSRTHLKTLLPELRMHAIPYHALDLDTLNKHPIIQDLLVLTRALLFFEDRIAWLALLRAPWCQLSLNDLLIVAEKSQETTVWQILDDHQNLPLSADGQQRMTKLVPHLRKAFEQNRILPIQTVLQSVFCALMNDIRFLALPEVEAYFELISQVANQEIGIFDLTMLYAQLEKTYIDATPSTDCKLSIMTVHKAKGLEFDTVILPGLGRPRRADQKPLLLTVELTGKTHTTDFLLAPLHASEEKTDSIYEGLYALEKQKARHEQTRLLYVATTRAKKKLYLFGDILKKIKNRTEIQ